MVATRPVSNVRNRREARGAVPLCRCWCAGGAVGGVLDRPAPGGVITVCQSACGVAAVPGRHWHHRRGAGPPRVSPTCRVVVQPGCVGDLHRRGGRRRRCGGQAAAESAGGVGEACDEKPGQPGRHCGDVSEECCEVQCADQRWSS
ncbi:hypothetical protein QR98_0085640 [Sarcoptes scabiei]|uniref:Uncharacterized protein n=1 Tax=Sarcoptes scabiei TaxID=52283 RepID=A0A132AGA1_SARSC|nr:hypothetical protein QR98_0085640 [Sarcoptes scabiei]